MTLEHTTTPRDIGGTGRTIRELLAGRKYSLDYYQREYKWGKKQVTALLEDLMGRFLSDYEPADERSAVKAYRNYFLGPIIVSENDGQQFIVDGQQRLTTLTLLLITLHHRLGDEKQQALIGDLIHSQQYGEISFNLEVSERTACMEHLYLGKDYSEPNRSESVSTMFARYEDIQAHFECSDEALPFFADWLLEKVSLVEITTYSDADAYTVFETMNDRGLPLSPADMLKSYLLANTGAEHRNRSSEVWKERMRSLSELGKEEGADEGTDSIKAWLRSQHAETIRERKRRALPRDFDRIGTECHRWVREQSEPLGLSKNMDFRSFIERDFVFYSQWYERLREASKALTTGFECVYFNAQNNFTLQYPVLLAPLRPDDAEEASLRKIRTTAAYLDILLHRRVWNYQSIGYSTMQYAMFTVMRQIRGMALSELVGTLAKRLAEEEVSFATNDDLRLHGRNGRYIHGILARITDFVETQSGQTTRYAEYVRRGHHRYEIEHIWANHFHRHNDEFAHEYEFEGYRNRVGGLLLLPQSFNASYGDHPYEQKLAHYLGQNGLARSLHGQAYEHNPGFLKFIETTGLPFKPHAVFKKADLNARQHLYRELAEMLWNPARLRRTAFPQGYTD